MYLNRKGILLLLLAVSVFSACRRSLDTGWDTRYLSPILTGELTIRDLVPDSVTVVNADESVTLVYQTELLNYDGEDSRWAWLVTVAAKLQPASPAMTAAEVALRSLAQRHAGSYAGWA